MKLTCFDKNQKNIGVNIEIGIKIEKQKRTGIQNRNKNQKNKIPVSEIVMTWIDLYFLEQGAGFQKKNVDDYMVGRWVGDKIV